MVIFLNSQQATLITLGTVCLVVEVVSVVITAILVMVHQVVLSPCFFLCYWILYVLCVDRFCMFFALVDLY
jgi:hypothetical protein